MNLESLTYRHVRVFLALYKSRSASRVAEELKMTNSAITRTIACLREILRVCNFLWAARSRLIDVGGDSVTK